VQRLVRERLLTTRRRDDDNRVTEVGLTNSGLVAVDTIRSVASDVYKQAFRGFTAEDIDELLKSLKRARKNLDE
jgi:DNA-binding MarR family transcriptional regulator